MNPPCILLAKTELDPRGLLAAWTSMNEDLRNQLWLVLAIAVLGVGALVWAAFYRQARKRRRHVHRPHTWQLEPGESRSARRQRQRQRRRRSEHPRPPQNPTLAETGGLPPKRPADQPPPGA